MLASSLPRPLVLLGLSGVAPQVICVALALSHGPYQWFGLAAGCLYAAIILSFLGGLWWMAGMMSGLERAWIYVIAVLPSLAAWAAMMPLALGWSWPGPSLIALGLLLLLSPLVDFAISRRITLPTAWLRLRVKMATGLGLLTLALAAL